MFSMVKRSLLQDTYLVSCAFACAMTGGFIAFLISNAVIQPDENFDGPALVAAFVSWIVTSITMAYLFHKRHRPQFKQILTRYVVSCLVASAPVAILYGSYAYSDVAAIRVEPVLVATFFVPFTLLMGLFGGSMLWLLYGLR